MCSSDLVITSDRPITKWDKLVCRDGIFGWLYKGLTMVIYGSELWYTYEGMKGFMINCDKFGMTRCTHRESLINQAVFKETIWVGQGNSFIYLLNNTFYDESLDDKGLANWKAHLNENPLEILTYSDTETFIPLAEGEQEAVKGLKTYYNQTHLSNSENLPMSVEYVADVSTYIYNASVGGVDLSGYTKKEELASHNTSGISHNDIRLLVAGLTSRLNAIADSDDTTLDQLSEIVAYIKSNKNLIDSVTTSKVNVTDIIDDLETNVGNKPLSAKQGVLLKGLIDAIVVPTKTSDLQNNSNFVSKEYVDNLFTEYITDIAELVGGDA